MSKRTFWVKINPLSPFAPFYAAGRAPILRPTTRMGLCNGEEEEIYMVDLLRIDPEVRELIFRTFAERDKVTLGEVADEIWKLGLPLRKKNTLGEPFEVEN